MEPVNYKKVQKVLEKATALNYKEMVALSQMLDGAKKEARQVLTK